MSAALAAAGSAVRQASARSWGTSSRLNPRGREGLVNSVPIPRLQRVRPLRTSVVRRTLGLRSEQRIERTRAPRTRLRSRQRVEMRSRRTDHPGGLGQREADRPGSRRCRRGHREPVEHGQRAFRWCGSTCARSRTTTSLPVTSRSRVVERNTLAADGERRRRPRRERSAAGEGAARRAARPRARCPRPGPRSVRRAPRGGDRVQVHRQPRAAGAQRLAAGVAHGHRVDRPPGRAARSRARRSRRSRASRRPRTREPRRPEGR